MKGESSRPFCAQPTTGIPLSLKKIEQFFDDAIDRFESIDAVHRTESRISIAGNTANVSAGNTRCIDLLSRAFSSPPLFLSHTDAESTKTDDLNQLSLRVWDSVSCGVEPLIPPWNEEHFSPFGEIRGCTSGRFLAAFEADAGALSMLDTHRHRAFYWCRDISRLPAYAIATPLRSIVQWWMRLHDLELIHGAAVGTSSGAVLIVGAGGAGKSNAALSCVNAGLDYLGDDYCLISDSASPHVFSAYSSAKLYPSDCTYFSQLLPSEPPSSVTAQPDKRTLWLGRSHPQRILPSAPLRAIIVMTPGNCPRTCIRTCSESTAFLAIAENTTALLQFGGGASFARIARLVRSAPLVHIERGEDARENIADIIGDILYKYDGNSRRTTGTAE